MIKRGKKKEDDACIKYHSKLKTMTTNICHSNRKQPLVIEKIDKV